MVKIPMNRILSKAKSHLKNGELREAQKLYQVVLHEFPQNKRAQQGLENLKKHKLLITSKSSLQANIDQLIDSYNQGQFAIVIERSKSLIEKYPEAYIVWNLLGAANKSLGRAQDALQAFKKVTELNSKYADGFNNYGVSLQEQNKLEEALIAFNKALSLEPNHAASFFNIGNVLFEQGKFESAVKAFKKTLFLEPNYAEAYMNLGNTFLQQKKIELAIKSFEKCLLLNPYSSEGHYNIGTALNKKGNFEKAIIAFSRAVQFNSKNADAWYNMGIALMEQGNLIEAIKSYQKTLKIRPDYSDAFYNMGIALQEQGKQDEALDSYERALSLNHKSDKIYNNIGLIFQEQGKQNEALASYKKALSINPKSAEINNNLGLILREQGKLEESIIAYKKALHFNPDNAEANRNITMLIKYELDDPQISLVGKLLKLSNLKDDDRCHLHYAYAKMQEDLGNFETAFKNYVAGGKIRKKIMSYDIKQDQIMFTQIKSTAPKIKEISINEKFTKIPHIPIFILGMPRSGTTLIEQVISAHSHVHGAGELSFLGRYGDPINCENETINSENILKVRKKYLYELEKVSNGKPFVTDKLPHNFLYIGLILKAIPEAKIIHLRRQPAATCWSIFKHYFSSSGLGFSYDLNDTVSYFGMYQELIKIWDDLYEKKIYHLDYDLLTEEQDTEIRKLIEYLELGWEEACLSPQENKRNVRTASLQQVRKNIYKGSSGAWRKFKPYLNNAFDKLV